MYLCVRGINCAPLLTIFLLEFVMFRQCGISGFRFITGSIPLYMCGRSIDFCWILKLFYCIFCFSLCLKEIYPLYATMDNVRWRVEPTMIILRGLWILEFLCEDNFVNERYLPNIFAVVVYYSFSGLSIFACPFGIHYLFNCYQNLQKRGTLQTRYQRICGIMVSVLECGRSWVRDTVGSNQRL